MSKKGASITLVINYLRYNVNKNLLFLFIFSNFVPIFNGNKNTDKKYIIHNIMELRTQIDYKDLSDEQLVELILALPHNEEAATYLLHERYHPLLYSIYWSLTNKPYWYEDCVSELHLHLRGKDNSWRILSNFEWRSTLGCWLKKVAVHKFIEILPKLIENHGGNISLDNDPEKSGVQMPDGGEEEYERRMRKVMLMEAIGQLKDDDQRFVIQKRLEGYNSNEIAILLQKRWEKQGIKKYNKDNKLVVPDAGYVDVRTQRAKENLRKIMGEL